MSWQATNYAAELTVCPDGAPLRQGHKLLLLLLANRHNVDERAAWPSLQRLCKELLASLSTLKRHLDYLEQHCVIEQRHPDGQGAGKKCSYVFLGLDEPQRLHERLVAISKGVQNTPLFSPAERDSKGGRLKHETGSEGIQKGFKNPDSRPRNKEELETTTDSIRNSTPRGALTGSSEKPGTPEGRAALKAWLAIKEEMRSLITPEEWKLWVRPAYLLKEIASGNGLLIALPPNRRLAEAARRRAPLLRDVAGRHGFAGVGITRYPDIYELERLREVYPEFYGQMYGVKKRYDKPNSV